MNQEEHKKFMQSVRQSQQRSRQVLQRIQSTLSGVRTTISEINDTNKKYDRIKEEYSKIMDKLAQKIANSFQDPLKRSFEDDPRPKPTKITMKEAVKAMMDHEQILFITGAGVSADSGIPTFRGQNGLYSKKFQFEGNYMDPDQFITKAFFDIHPQPIWQWIESLYQMTAKSKPNNTHLLIHQCLQQLSKKGKKPVLVTQNIDDLHIRPVNNQYEYYPIHGVGNKMRCKNLHMIDYNISKIHQKCPQCQQTMRPHVMFFDQSYGIPFGGEVKNRDFEFVVVIGSSLSTGLCIKFVTSALEVIQINPNPVIEVGDVHPFSDQTNKVLKQMIDCIKNHQQ